MLGQEKMEWAEKRLVVLCFAVAYPSDQTRKFPKPANKLSVRRNCEVKLDRRKKNLPNTKDHLNSAMCVLRHAHGHTPTYTHTPHMFYQCFVVIDTLLNFACNVTSVVTPSNKKCWLTLNSVLNIEDLSITWA